MELNVYPETVIFNGSSNVSYVRVTSPSDTVLENNGYFTLSLSLASPSSIMNNVVLSPNSINVTAVDNAGEQGCVGVEWGVVSLVCVWWVRVISWVLRLVYQETGRRKELRSLAKGKIKKRAVSS